MKWHYLIFYTLMIVSSGTQPGDTVYYSDSGHAEFTSSVPLHTFTGESDHLTGMIDLEENIIDFYLDLKTLKTGNGRRDRDMYETLNIDEHPFAEFTGSLETSFDTTSSERQNVSARGDFTINGVTRTKTVSGTLQKVDGGLRLTAEWIQDITDHEIEPPGILFYRVDKEMEIRVEAMLQPRERERL